MILTLKANDEEDSSIGSETYHTVLKFVNDTKFF